MQNCGEGDEVITVSNTAVPTVSAIVEELKKRDVLVNISYPWPIHIMTGYQYLGYKEGDFPHTEKAAREIFSLPCIPLS